MLHLAAILLTAVYIASPKTYFVYEDYERHGVVCEAEEVLTGIYTDSSYVELERKTAPQDIYITYLNQGSPFPSDFVTLCTVKDRLPLIVYRPTDYSYDDIGSLVSRIAQYNIPFMLQIDASYSDKAKDFFRTVADEVHSCAPKTALIWGVSSEKVGDITSLYPGDEYVDWVAVNIFEGADREGLNIDPYPFYAMLSYFERSKPVMLNISVASYTEDGHRYFAYEAADEIERLYSKAEETAAICAVNYISRSSSQGSADANNSQAVLKAIGSAVQGITKADKIRLPMLAHQYNNSFYCGKGAVCTEDEYCILNGRRYYKISGRAGYSFVEN